MVAYTHLAEFLPGRVSKMSALMLFLDGMILVVSPTIFQFVTNKTDVFLYAGLMMNIIGLAAFTLQYIPESIKFQLENARDIGARKDIEYVLRFNKASESEKAAVLDKVDRLIAKNKHIREREALFNKGLLSSD